MKKILALISTALVVFIFYPQITSYANELTTIEITDDPGTIEDRVLTTYKVDSEDGHYTVIVNGVTDYNKEEYTSKVLENVPNLTQDKPIKFTNNMFVDTNKYCYLKEGYDAYHCWLSSTSNMLVISGWDEGFENPVMPAGTKSYEDEIFAFFTTYFTDKGSLPENAISFFLEGNYGVEEKTASAKVVDESTNLKSKDGLDFKGVNSDYCSGKIVNRINIETENNNYLEAAELFEKLENSAMATSIGFIDLETDEIQEGSHSITITGIVIDNTKSGLDKYIAIIIADSDNEECEKGFPQSMEEAFEYRKSKPNSYTMYALGTYDNSYGQTLWGLYGYGDNRYAVFANMTSLEFKNDDSVKKAIEKAPNATKDCHESADIVLTNFFLYDDEFSLSGEFALGENINVIYQLFNRSDFTALSKESAGKDEYQITFYVYRDGELVGEISDGFTLDLNSRTVEAAEVVDGTANLTDSGLFNEPGLYTVKFVFNTNDANEAYIANNTQIEETFVIVGDGSTVATESDVETKSDASTEDIEVTMTDSTGKKSDGKRVAIIVVIILGVLLAASAIYAYVKNLE